MRFAMSSTPSKSSWLVLGRGRTCGVTSRCGFSNLLAQVGSGRGFAPFKAFKDVKVCRSHHRFCNYIACRSDSGRA